MTQRALARIVSVALIGFVAQFVDGTLGMGYGVFSATLLVASGLMPKMVSASVHTAEVFSTLASGLAHHGFGNVDKTLVVALSIPGVLGGVVGALCLANVPGEAVKPWVAGFLLCMGVVVVMRFMREKPNCQAPGQNDAPKGLSKGRIGLVGFLAAALDAFGGGGWGPIATPTLLLGHNVMPHKVIGSVNLSEFFVTSAIALTFMLSIGPEHFEWTIVACLLVGGVLAAPTAAWVCKKLPHRALGISVGVLLVLTNIRTLWLALH